MQVNNNVNRMMLNYFNQTNAAAAKSVQAIASGSRISSASDDAAGMAMGMEMRARATGIDVASQNTQDALSMVRTADGVLGNVSDVLGRMGELAARAGNGILSADQRGMMQQEFDQLSQEIDRIGKSSSFNGNQLFDGSTYTMQVGEGADDRMDISMGQISAASLGLDGVDLSSVEGAASAMDSIKDATGQVSGQRGSMGAFENRLQHNYNSLTNQGLETTTSMSRIMDADIAKGIMNLNQSNILKQVSTAMMSNAANMMQYNVQQLLR